MEVEKETWITIEHHDNYEVSDLGNVRNKKSKSLLKPFVLNNKYLKVTLSKNGKAKQFFIHRLVAEAFIPNPNNLPQVNHIKEFEKTNNCVENLEWCNHSYNQNYGTRNARVSEKLRKKIIQYDLNDNYIKAFNSLAEASKQTGIFEGNISYVANDKRKSAGGYKWRYANES